MNITEMETLKLMDPEVYDATQEELKRQKNNIELIASENIVSKVVLEAMGSIHTNKYAEGYPGKRYYGGCEHVDVIEKLACARAKKLFGAEHANVQPHSGSQANMAVYNAVLDLGDTILGMNLSHGGHLTHGSRVNFSGKQYKFVEYGVDKETEVIDYDEVRRIAVETNPKMIVAGASAYSRKIDFAKFREIADEVGSYLMVDMAHIAGLVATGAHDSPVPYADFVTTTTHKTLRGPRGGMILCKGKYAMQIDKAVFPGIQGGPLMHIIAAKAVSFNECLSPDYKVYIDKVIENAEFLSESLVKHGYRIVSGGTDNHLMLVDVTSVGLDGKTAEALLDQVGITVNKNTIPFDTLGPGVTSGIRIGTPAVTTRGFGKREMLEIADIIDLVLRGHGNNAEMRERVVNLANQFPIYC